MIVHVSSFLVLYWSTKSLIMYNSRHTICPFNWMVAFTQRKTYMSKKKFHYLFAFSQVFLISTITLNIKAYDYSQKKNMRKYLWPYSQKGNKILSGYICKHRVDDFNWKNKSNTFSNSISSFVGQNFMRFSTWSTSSAVSSKLRTEL